MSNQQSAELNKDKKQLLELRSLYQIPGFQFVFPEPALRGVFEIVDAEVTDREVEDGGFWLIGHQGKPPTKLFDGVRWSSPWAYLDTIETFEGQSFSCLSKLRDVDSLLDLEALKVKCHN